MSSSEGFIKQDSLSNCLICGSLCCPNDINCSLYDLVISVTTIASLETAHDAARDLATYFRAQYAIVGTNDALVALGRLTRYELDATLKLWHRGEDNYAILRAKIFRSICAQAQDLAIPIKFMFDDKLPHQSVLVKGSWDAWAAPIELQLTRHSYWEADLKLLPGEYHCKFWLEPLGEVKTSSLHPSRSENGIENNLIEVEVSSNPGALISNFLAACLSRYAAYYDLPFGSRSEKLDDILSAIDAGSMNVLDEPAKLNRIVQISGGRGSGKTVLCWQAIRALVEVGIPRDKIFYCNFEELRPDFLHCASFHGSLELLLVECVQRGFQYFFLDEVLKVDPHLALTNRFQDAHCTGADGARLIITLPRSLSLPHGRSCLINLTTDSYCEFLNVFEARSLGCCFDSDTTSYANGGFPFAFKSRFSPGGIAGHNYFDILLNEIVVRDIFPRSFTPLNRLSGFLVGSKEMILVGVEEESVPSNVENVWDYGQSMQVGQLGVVGGSLGFIGDSLCSTHQGLLIRILNGLHGSSFPYYSLTDSPIIVWQLSRQGRIMDFHEEFEMLLFVSSAQCYRVLSQVTDEKINDALVQYFYYACELTYNESNSVGIGDFVSMPRFCIISPDSYPYVTDVLSFLSPVRASMLDLSPIVHRIIMQLQVFEKFSSIETVRVDEKLHANVMSIVSNLTKFLPFWFSNNLYCEYEMPDDIKMIVVSYLIALL